MLQLIFLLSNLLMAAVAGGMLLVGLAQSNYAHHEQPYFGLWAALLLWSWTAILILFPDSVTLLHHEARVSISLSALTFLIFVYFLFILDVAEMYDGTWSYLTYVIGSISVFGVAALWLDWSFSLYPVGIMTDGILFSLTVLGQILGILGILSLGIVFWIVMSSDDPKVQHLRLPALLPMVAMALAMVPSRWTILLSNMFVLITAVTIGWLVLKDQLINPLEDLNDELRIANGDLKQAINELAREKSRVESLNHELAESNTQKTNFLATMSHELRTPLNSIVGYSELLADGIYGKLTDQQQDRLEKIHRNGRALLDVINVILDLNKIESGRLKLEREVIDLAKLLDNDFEALKTACESKDLSFELDIVRNLPGVRGDSLRLRQIVHNLTDNALKFTNKGKISLALEHIQVVNGNSDDFALPMIGWLSDGHWILVTVADTGIGIAPEDQAIIFEEFTQVDSGANREFDGTGLGLSITRRLVELHSGSIWVKSALGEGSRFYTALPTAETLKGFETDY